MENYKRIQKEKELWYTTPVLGEMEKAERIRYLSMLLINGDLPYEFNYGAVTCIKEFVDSIKEKESFSAFKAELNELDEILEEVFQMGKRGVEDSTRSHPVMKRAENWTRNYESKGKILLEIVESMSDEDFLS